MTKQQRAPGRTATSKSPKAEPKPATGKIGKVVAMLKRPQGASIAQLMKATNWQAHSVRGAISGTIKHKMGLNVSRVASGTVGTYRIVA